MQLQSWHKGYFSSHIPLMPLKLHSFHTFIVYKECLSIKNYNSFKFYRCLKNELIATGRPPSEIQGLSVCRVWMGCKQLLHLIKHSVISSDLFKDLLIFFKPVLESLLTFQWLWLLHNICWLAIQTNQCLYTDLHKKEMEPCLPIRNMQARFSLYFFPFNPT